MHRPEPHENDPLYAWPGDDYQPPLDLASYFREFKPGYMGYVCPRCRNVFAPGFAGMPGAFRTHVREFQDTGGCFFDPATRRSGKVAQAKRAGAF